MHIPLWSFSLLWENTPDIQNVMEHCRLYTCIWSPIVCAIEQIAINWKSLTSRLAAAEGSYCDFFTLSMLSILCNTYYNQQKLKSIESLIKKPPPPHHHHCLMWVHPLYTMPGQGALHALSTFMQDMWHIPIGISMKNWRRILKSWHNWDMFNLHGAELSTLRTGTQFQKVLLIGRQSNVIQ